MSPTHSFFHQLRQLIGQDNLPEALRLLQAFCQNTPQLNDAIQQSGRYEDICQQVRLGTVSDENATLTKNKIRWSLLELLTHIEQQGKSGSLSSLLQVVEQQAAEPSLGAEVAKAISIVNSKNVVTGNISAGGNVTIGDHYHAAATAHTPKDLTARIPTIAPEKIVGRDTELADLRTRLFNHQQVVLVNGLGGIGKTTLAQAYLSKYYGEYRHIAWVSQVSGNFLNDLVNTEGLCLSLRIPTEGKDLEGLFQDIIMGLKGMDGQPCLLVIDNADASLARFYDYLPRQPQWHILATSREHIERFDEKKLGFLSEADAIALFRQHYTLGKIAEADIRSLVQTVDRHTLTIELLAKTAQKQRTGIAELQHAIEADLRAMVYVPHNANQIQRVSSYLNSIFNLSPLDNSEAWLMQQFACLPAEHHAYDTLLELIDPAAAEKSAVFAETLQNLSDKGWLLHNADADAWKMHRIIAEITARQLPPSSEVVLPLINSIANKLSIDQTKDNPIDKFQWIPFGRSLLAAIEHLEFNEKAILQNNLALVLKDLGDYAGAKGLLEKAMASDEKNFGTEHPTTAVRYSNLATVLKALGDYAGAKGLLEKALASDEKNFGTEHPTTAVRYSNLSLVLKDLGDYAGAKGLLEKAMASYEKNFGAEHPSTAQIYSNLATVLQSLGDYAGAKGLLEKAMASYEKNFGAEHPSTARSYSNLAMVLQDLGDYAGAKGLLEKALASDEKNFGTDHPTTAGRYYFLTNLLQDLGDYAGAKGLLEKAMASAEKSFGTDHPTTAVRYSNLATVYFHLKQVDAAISLLEKAYQVYRNHFGEEHPQTKIMKERLDFVKRQA